MPTPLRSLLGGALLMAGSATAAPALHAQPMPDPRVGLKAGWFDAGEASWNIKLVSNTKNSEAFLNLSTPGDARLKNSDLAFSGNLVFQGNYSGWQVWDIGNPRKPKLRAAFVCPGSQSDVTVYGNLLFVSAEAVSGRVDCGLGGVQDEVSKDRARGIRIIDISDIEHPRSITTVQTCRGSHTNTLVTDPKDPENVYIYVSGSAGVRSNEELAGCSAANPDIDPNSSLFRIEVIKVPVKNPAAAAIVSSPRIFEGLGEAVRHADAAADRRERPAGAPARPSVAGRGGPTQCHDITTYPAVGLAGGACSGYGILLDIRDIKNPKRLYAAADTNMSAWHSATFSNDGSKVLFSDEWGGGTAPRCRATDKKEWGADAIFVRNGDKLDFKSYFKLPAAQSNQENCVAHNGSLIPIPGREVMVQSWYQGGINVFDWTDPNHAFEIGFFDRGPMDSTALVSAGHWSAYWYNGLIYGSEIARGLDVWELTPSEFITKNELDAAKLVKYAYFNAQEQPQAVWPPAFVVARAYTDQMARNSAVPKAWLDGVVAQLASAEKAKGAKRAAALNTLAAQLDTDAAASPEAKRVTALSAVVKALAK